LGAAKEEKEKTAEKKGEKGLQVGTNFYSTNRHGKKIFKPLKSDLQNKMLFSTTCGEEIQPRKPKQIPERAWRIWRQV